jgi:hypothetical protein
MIEAKGLTKHYGATVAVDELSFTVPPRRPVPHRPGPARLRAWHRLPLQCRRRRGLVRRAVRATLLTALLPSSWQDTLGRYLPMNAGDTIYTVRPEPHMLGPWTGFGVFCLYAAAALAAGFVLIGRRDA